MSFKKILSSALRLVFIAIFFLLLGFKGIAVSALMLIVYEIKGKISEWKTNVVKWFADLASGKKREPEDDTPTGRQGKPVLAADSLRQLSVDLCRENQNLVKGGALQWITKMNWKYTPPPVHGKTLRAANKVSYKGQLHTVLAQTREKRRGCVILGRAGAGKTSVLKEYMLLVMQNDQQFQNEMKEKPLVYLSLASWDQAQSLRSWMTRELQTMYAQATTIANLMAKTQDYIIPVLDGLDQVPGEFRDAVLRGIYEYGKIDGNRIFVTSRPSEFWELRDKLDDSQAPFDEYFCTLELEPLLPGQIEEAVSPEILPDVLTLVKGSDNMQEFASFPMGLSILVQVINTLEPEDIRALQQANKRAEIFARLWEKYEETVLHEAYHRGAVAKKKTELPEVLWQSVRRQSFETITQLFRKPYSEDKTKQWLRRLCPLLRTNFSLENLQPDFLQTKNDKLLYFILSRTLCTMALSLSLGFFLSGPAGYLGAGVVAGYSLLLPNLLKGRFPTTTAARSVHGWLFYLCCPILFFIPAAATLMVYFGFITPRLHTDMVLAGHFALTEANIGIFMGFFIGSIFALRDLRQNEKNDIRLMALAPKNIRQLLKYGVVGSVMLTLTLILACYLVLTFAPGSSLGEWAAGNHHGMDITLLAIPAGIVFGFPLFGILGWLHPSPSENTPVSVATTTANPRHILRSTLNNGWQAGIFAGLIIIPLFSIFFAYLTKGELTSISKGVRAGIGASMLAMLWFGGFDLIQYYALKIVIAVRGHGPWDVINFLEHTSRLRLTHRIGAAHSFIHPTLASYFDSTPYTATQRRRLGLMVLPILVVLGAQLLIAGLPFYQRYQPQYFWQSPYGYRIEGSITSFLVPLDKNTFVVTGLPKNTCTLEITASGEVKAGEFTGYVSPAGTEAAFLGFSIGNVYDLDSARTGPFCHCAVLLKKQHGYTRWYSFPAETWYSLFSNDKKLRLSVVNGDTLHIVVNDREWHNNTGIFRLKIAKTSPLPTQVVAHRGGAALAPENSIAALETSLALGVDMIEIDIRQTRDKHLVLMHDATVNRTTHGEGLVADLDWSEIQTMTLRDTSLGVFHVPDLPQVLDIMKDRQTRLLIEVKNPSDYPGIGRNLLQLLLSKGMTEQVVIISFDKDFIATMELDAPEIQTGWFAWGFWQALYQDIPDVDYLGISYYGGLLLSDHMLPEYRKTKKKILVWTVDYPGSMQSLLDMKVDGIITNHPDKLKKLIAQ